MSKHEVKATDSGQTLLNELSQLIEQSQQQVVAQANSTLNDDFCD